MFLEVVCPSRVRKQERERGSDQKAIRRGGRLCWRGWMRGWVGEWMVGGMVDVATTRWPKQPWSTRCWRGARLPPANPKVRRFRPIHSGQVRPGCQARPPEAGRVIRTYSSSTQHTPGTTHTHTHTHTLQHNSLTHSLEPRGDQHRSRIRARARAILARPNMHHIARDIERIPYIGEVVEGKVVHK